MGLTSEQQRVMDKTYNAEYHKHPLDADWRTPALYAAGAALLAHEKALWMRDGGEGPLLKAAQQASNKIHRCDISGGLQDLDVALDAARERILAHSGAALLEAENAALKAPVSDEQTVWYHGTTLKNAASIIREGFREGTWFARHMEDAAGFGGDYVFSVRVAFNVEDDRWQVCCSNKLAPCQIEKLAIMGETAKGDEPIAALIAARAVARRGYVKLEDVREAIVNEMYCKMSMPELAERVIQRIAALEAENTALKAPVRQEEIEKIQEDPTMRSIGYLQMCHALIAARAEETLKAPVSDTAFDLLKRMTEKLHIVLPKLDSFVVLEAVCSGDSNIYDGPSLEQELKEADALIAARVRDSKEADNGKNGR